MVRALLIWFSLLGVIVCSGACVGPRADPRTAAADDAISEEIVTDDNWTVIGYTVQGRPIRSRVVGIGPRRVLWVGGIHGNEREGAVATAHLQDAFLSAGDLEEAVTLTILEDINPDGSAANSRRNAGGKDLNRNFPAQNALPNSEPLSEPESRVLHDLIESFEPDVVMVAHSWRTKPDGVQKFVNYDGPADRLAEIFSVISGYPVRASKHLPPTPGSLGSWVGIDKQIPILTIEYKNGMDADEAWVDTREAILAVIRG